MARGNWIVVEAQVDEVQKALAGTSKSMRSIQRQAVGIVARKGVRLVRKHIRQAIADRSRSKGALAKSYGFRVRKDGSQASIYPRGEAGSSVFPKAFVNNWGHTGPTKRAAEWKVAPKGFVQRTEEELSSDSFRAELGAMVDKVLRRYWGQ